MLAAEYELDADELYRKVHKQLVRSATTLSPGSNIRPS